MIQFKPVKTNRIFEDVLVQLKDSILSGRFKPGEKLPSERELSLEFQVSRGVIREAIRALELRGFVGIRQGPAGGAYVTDLTFNQVGNAFLDLFKTNKLSMQDIAQVRLHVEPEVARQAALNFNTSHEDILMKAEQEEHIDYVSYEDRIDRLTRVHKSLARICGNQFFEVIVRSMLMLTAEVVLTVASDHDLLHGPGEHQGVIQAVISGDGDGAAREMARHLQQFSHNLIKMEKTYRQRYS
ncbi:MAG: FadR family transcriptional regulator [Thermodesulfobacteriota bacterium]|nr:FadR family transcriptional regulator [Thermodesulfobacteriota bacterium]